MSSESTLRLERIAGSDAHDLRRRVLRSHLPGATVSAAEDDDTATTHVAAKRGQRIVGVVTVFLEEAPGRPGEPAARFRWMAVEPAEQGNGVGRLLMADVERRARDGGARVLWANGRDSALGFYTGLGFTVVGDAFTDAVSLLPHHVVMRDL